jgi:Uma2 family endonuclease
MPTEVSRKLFTVDQYHRMGETGILDEDERVELIDGEIIRMSPIGARHAACVSRGMTFFFEAFGRRAVLHPQNPVQLSNWTEPQPDILVLKPRKDFYSAKTPKAEDVLFVVEVADSTLRYDCDVKVPRFAAGEIPEVWIEDLQHDLLLLYRDPSGEDYKTTFTRRAGESISPLAFPDVTFRVDDLLGVSGA